MWLELLEIIDDRSPPFLQGLMCYGPVWKSTGNPRNNENRVVSLNMLFLTIANGNKN